MLHRLDEFPTSTGSALPPHLQIYTWPSCTLRELSHLLTSALPNLLPDPIIGTRLSYRLIFPDTREASRQGPGRFMSKELGSVVVGGDGPGILPTEEEANVVATGPMAGALNGEPDKSLQDARFVIGDYISCAIFAPLANGSVAPPPTTGSAGRAGRVMNEFGGGRGGVLGGPRENGFGGFRVRGSGRGGGPSNWGRQDDGGLPSGEWRRGERVPDGPGGGRGGYGRGRGRGGY